MRVWNMPHAYLSAGAVLAATLACCTVSAHAEGSPSLAAPGRAASPTAPPRAAGPLGGGKLGAGQLGAGPADAAPRRAPEVPATPEGDAAVPDWHGCPYFERKLELIV